MARRNLRGIGEKILAETAHLASEQGFGTISAKRIAEACGITDATVFVYYKDKPTLLKKTYEYALSCLNSTIEDYSSSRAGIKAITERLLEFCFERISLAKYIMLYRQAGAWTGDEVDGKKDVLIRRLTGTRFGEGERYNAWTAYENILISVVASLYDSGYTNLRQSMRYIAQWLYLVFCR